MLELHDSSIQSIYAIGLTLENSRRLLEKDPAQAVRTLADAGANLNLVIQDLRAFITRERRAPLSEQEFMQEIERMIPPPEQGAPRFSVDVDRSAHRRPVAGPGRAPAAHGARGGEQHRAPRQGQERAPRAASAATKASGSR